MGEKKAKKREGWQPCYNSLFIWGEFPYQFIQPFHRHQSICMKVGYSQAPIQPLDIQYTLVGKF